MAKLIASGLLSSTKFEKHVRETAAEQNHVLINETAFVAQSTDGESNAKPLSVKKIKDLLSRISKSTTMSEELGLELDAAQALILNEAGVMMDRVMDRLTDESNLGIIGGSQIVSFFLIYLTRTMLSLDRKDLLAHISEKNRVDTQDEAFKALSLATIETLYQLLLTHPLKTQNKYSLQHTIN